MPARVQALDWSRTPLGPIDGWPLSLRTLVGTVLSAPFPIVLWWGRDLTMIYNDAYAPLLGGRHPEALGRSSRDVWAEAWPKIGPLAEAVLQRGESVRRERDHFVLERNGAPEDAWFTWSYSPVRDETGAISGLLNIAQEDTGRLQAEAALQASEQRFRALATASGDVLYQLNADWSELQPLDGKTLIVGTDKPIRDWMQRNIPPSEHAAIREQISRCIATKSVFEMEHRVYRPDGSIGWTHSRAVPVLDDTGEIADWMGTAADVTARRQADEQLRRSQATFYHLIQNNPFGVYVVDADFRLREVSLGAQKVFAHVPRPLLGRDFAEVLRSIWAEPFATEAIGRFRHTLDTGEAFSSPSTLERRADIEEVEAYDWRIERVTLPDGRFGVVCYFYDLSERQRWEAALQESEARFRLMADAVPQIVWITDATGRVQFFNQQWSNYTGINYAPATADDVAATVIHPDDRPATKAAFDAALQSGETFCVEHRILSATGEYRWFLVRGEPHRDSQTGQITRWFGASVDIHDRRQAEEALRQSEERLRAVFEQTEAGIAQVDLTGRFVLVNDRYGQIVGRSREDLLGLRMQDITHPDDLTRNLALFQRAVEDGSSFVIEKRYLRPDGTEVWVSNSVSLLRGGDGKPSGVIAATVDISDRRRAEQVLRESEAHARRIIDNTLSFVGVMTPDGTLTEANTTALRSGGLRREDVVGKKFWDCYWWSYDRKVQHQLRDAVAQAAAGEVVRYDVVVRMAGDTRMPIDFMLSPVRDERGRITHLIPSGVDIAERTRVEEALRESEARLRLAVSIAQMGTFHIDLLTDAVTVNDAGRGIYGWSLSEPLTFARVQSHFHPDDREDVMRRVAEAFDPDGSGEFDLEQRIIRTDDATRWIRVRGRALFDAAGSERRAIRCVGTYIDITDQKEAERRREEVLEQERAARAEAERASRMKDEFLATLSHELRTPLNAILGWSQILAHGKRDTQDLAEGLRTIERNARAQTQIIEDLLDMSRIISGKVRLDVQRIDITEVVREAVATARPSADAKGIRLQAVLDPRAGPVSGDPARLQQVMWNLLTNAVKFTPKGGRVQVLLERVNSHVEINVIDTGEGIPAEFLQHVFDRFRQADATTTRRHGGLGLGLSIVKQLVEMHGGTVRVKSAGLGQGTTFTVSLPLTVIHPEPDPDVERHHPRVSSANAGLQESCVQIAGVKVLVVDDEPDARALVKRLLEECDAKVITAGSAAEALELVRAETPDVLVCDIGMPGEDGYSLIRRLRTMGPENGGQVPAAALTAYARAEDRVKAVLAGFQMHLAKPVEPAELIATVAGLAGRIGKKGS